MNFQDCKLELCAGFPEQLPFSTLPEVVFSGKSNVGKSSLINKILNRKYLARTSSNPGKTATVNFYKVDCVYFVDLPGYGYAKVSLKEKEKWARLVDSYLFQERNFKLFFQLIDVRHKISENDFKMLNFLKEKKFNFIIIFTKSDKLKTGILNERKEELEKELVNFNNIKKIYFSAVTGQGMQEIKQIVSSI